jgi:adenylate kinase family enzyme
MSKMNSDPQENPLWELLGSIASAWGGDRGDIPVLRMANRIVQSGKAVRTYLEAKRLENMAIGGATRDEINRRGIAPIGSSNHIDRLCLRYAEHTTTKKVFSDGDEKLVEMTLPDDQFLYLQLSESNQRMWVHNVFIKPGSIDPVQRAVASLVWHVEEGSGLQLVSKRDWDDRYLDVVPVTGSGDYVMGDGGTTSALDDMLSRTKKFLAAGHARKVLLYGPPGTGKTTLAHKLAEGLGGRLLQMSGKNTRDHSSSHLLQFIDMLRPDVILLDDIDRNMDAMESLLEVLGQADHVLKGKITVVGTVNSIKQLDPALLRPGRFDEVLECKEPDEPYLRRVAQHYATKFDVRVPLDQLVKDMLGFTPADVQEVLKSTGVVGEDVYSIEVERVRTQRKLHAGDRCEQYLNNAHTNSHPISEGDECPPTLTKAR